MAVEEEMFPARSARSPLVLVGAIATAGVLVAGLVAFKKGNSQLSQSLMRTRVVFQARLGCKRRERARGAHAAVAPAGRDCCGHGRYLEHRGHAEVASQFALQGRCRPRPLVSLATTPMRGLIQSAGRAGRTLWHTTARRPAQSLEGTFRSVLACEHTRDFEHRTSGAAFARQASTESQPRHGASDGVPPGSARPAEERSEPALRLLEHSLPFVRTLGWTDDALRAGALSAGLSPASIGLLPRGAAQLVEHFTSVCDHAFVEALDSKQDEFAGMRTQHRIAAAVRMRLEMLKPYIVSWAQALSLQAQPQNALAALRQRAALVDEIWHAAGDKSSDLSWYSKRATLGAVYTAVELFMLTDVSPEYEETWAFLDRSLRGAAEAGKAVSELSLAAATALRGVTRRFDHAPPDGPSHAHASEDSAQDKTKSDV